MKCDLDGNESKLCESHVIPKFVYTWMKKTGAGRLRNTNMINKLVYDGIKKRMLCKQCEDKFAKHEKSFSEKVFHPYLEDKNLRVKNNDSLKYFVISILWRVLKFYKDDSTKHKFQKELDDAELEWRKFLLSDEEVKIYKNIHFILLDESYCGTLESELYFLRAVDIQIVQWEEELGFIYAKFARFMLIGEITGFLEGDFTNTNISSETEFNNANQKVYDLIEYFKSRIDSIPSFYDMSENQQSKNNVYFKDKLESLQNSDYLKIIRKHK